MPTAPMANSSRPSTNWSGNPPVSAAAGAAGVILTPRSSAISNHLKVLERAGLVTLNEGQKVSYEEGRGPKGPRAEKVRPQ